MGAPIWIVAAVITGVTEDTILLPTVVLLGSFLVPITLVAFALSRPNHLPVEVVLLGFLGGGTLGVCFAALTEVYILPTAYGTFFGVGLIEEGAKAIVLVAAARGLSTRRPREGMILGATVGAGFAAFESSGYALKAFLENIDDHGVLNIVGTEAVRASRRRSGTSCGRRSWAGRSSPGGGCCSRSPGWSSCTRNGTPPTAGRSC